jgi:2-polyprenyl-3-methyl-5-hydroxy-6-metoxy-1,4-benzoquinol methylase
VLPWGYEYLAVLDCILQEVLRHRPSRVLDFGCGDGRLLWELARRTPATIAGVDLSGRALSFARGFLGGSSADFYEDLGAVPSDSFDVAVAMEVLEHISDAELPGVLADIHDRLVPDGLFVVSVPTTNQTLSPKHYRHYTPELLAEQTAGRFVITHTRFVHRLGRGAGLLRRLVCNRFAVVTYRPWLRLTTALYRRHLLDASSHDGAHLVAVMRKQ